MHYTRPEPSLAAGAGVLVCALIACGAEDPTIEPGDAPEQSPTGPVEQEEDDGQSSEGADEESPRTELSIVIEIDADAQEVPEQGEPAQWGLTCEPEGGDHPDPESACADLQALDLEILEPVSGDQACTMVYGGPEAATVSGYLDGTEISAEFARSDGCEMHRWDEMGAVLDP